MGIILVEKRRSGKTTGLLLQALGRALINPGEPISFRDHCRTCENLEHLKEILENMINSLNLSDIEISVNKKGEELSIISKFHGVYQGNDGNLYKRV